MAPGLRRPYGYHGIINGNKHSNETPPSTIAAQIVNNLSTAKGQHKAEDRENFEQLLCELLSAGDEAFTDGAAIETDPNINYKLICVVTRAGLGNLLHDDPFADHDHCLSQAMRCLTVLQLTIQKSRTTLFDHPSTFVDDDTIKVPLYVWFLPKLLAVLGHPQAEPLQDKVTEVLIAVVLAAAGSSKPWFNIRRLLMYFKSCVTGSIPPINRALSWEAKFLI